MIPFFHKKKIVGIQVPIFSLFSKNLPSKDKGTFASGIIFLEWLKKTKQSAWQVLPLHETQLEEGSLTKHVSSPYKSYGVGLNPKYLPSSWEKIFPGEAEKKKFTQLNSDWISDYSLFCALRDHFQTDDWRKWDEDIRLRKEKSLIFWQEKLKEKIDFYLIQQWQTHKAYKDLRLQARKNGIYLIGDIPFYLSVRSPLVWAHQDVFFFGENFTLPFVSGIPDTPNSHFGRQVWGHPLYNWREKESHPKIIAFWKMRLKYLSTLIDFLRFDHAKAFFDYGIIDIDNKQSDRYEKGPGAEVFEELLKFCKKNGLSVFAEDSGENLAEVRQSLKKLNIPGIKILRFAYEEKKNKLNLSYADIGRYPANTVAYTTTHDTETLLGYLQNLTAEQKQKLSSIAKVDYSPDDSELAKRFRKAVISSPAFLVIIPIQDWFLLTERINIPGTEKEKNDPNWQFAMNIPIEEFPVLT